MNPTIDTIAEDLLGDICTIDVEDSEYIYERDENGIPISYVNEYMRTGIQIAYLDDDSAYLIIDRMNYTGSHCDILKRAIRWALDEGMVSNDTIFDALLTVIAS